MPFVTGQRAQRSRLHLHRREQRGAIAALAGILMLLLVGVVGLAVDLSYLAFTHGELQDASDSAALAAMHELRRGRSQAQARQSAINLAQANMAAGGAVQLATSDVVFGNFDFDARTFLPGRNFQNPAAVRVVARRTQGSPGGPLTPLFASVLGIGAADVSADAVAAIGERELVIVQDITHSFFDEIEQAKDADSTLVRAMAAQNLGGESVGVVTFNDDSQVNMPITQLHGSERAIDDAIQDIVPCPSTRARNCRGTHIAPGLNEAVDLFRREGRPNAQRVIVLVSDGMPYPNDRRQPAIDAANEAARENINIFTVTLTQENGGSYGVGGDDAAFNARLVRGFGHAYHTPNAEDLDDLMLRVLRGIPIHLVE
jgi:Flp pilus assembly protein TadG